MQSRLLEITRWLKTLFPNESFSLKPMTKDASYKIYNRITVKGKNYVVMYAPLEKESPDAFFRLTRILRSFHINSPECYSYHQDLGFLLLDDFGDNQLYHKVQGGNILIYDKVLRKLPTLWNVNKELVPNYECSKFDQEIDLMCDWYFELLGVPNKIFNLYKY